MLRQLYDQCVRVAAGSSRSTQQAADLAHDVLLDVLARGTADLTTPDRRAWLYGALRRHAAFDARTQGRGRAREARWQAANEDHRDVEPRPWRFTPELLDQLSPALRVVAVLASAELAPREIRSVLRLTDTAFRKRLSDLGRAVREAVAAGIAVVGQPQAAYALGTVRAELLKNLRSHPTWAIASHDPDGHPLIFSRIDAHRSRAHGNSDEKEKSP